MKNMKSQTALFSFHKFPLEGNKILTFVYDDDDNNATADTYTYGSRKVHCDCFSTAVLRNRKEMCDIVSINVL